jgi:hypothetical protein
MRIPAGIHARARLAALAAAAAVGHVVALADARRDDPAPAQARPAAASSTPRETGTADGPPAPVTASDAARRTAEAAHAELLRELVPPSLDAEGIAAIARSLGLDARTAEAVEHHAAAYRTAVTRAEEQATAVVRARLGSGWRTVPGTGAQQPVAGPELAAALAEAAAWRRTLSAADSQLIQRLAGVRLEVGPEGPGLVLYRRTVSRDGLPADDPMAGLRLTDLLDLAAPEPTDRAAVAAALEPQWARAAALAATRRAEADAEAAEREARRASWGADWELTAPEALVRSRGEELAALARRTRQAESALGIGNREAVAAMLRVLAMPAADRVREAMDAAVWPELWAPERAFESAVERATAAAADPALQETLASVRGDLLLRLSSTRRETVLRAERAERTAAATDADERAGTTADRLLAERALEDMLQRRRRLVRAAVLRVQQYCAGHPDAARHAAAALAAIDSIDRAAGWRIQGIDDRLAELGQPAPAEDARTAPFP